MREETMIEAINDIDSIRCMVEDMHGEITNTPDYWTRLEHQYVGMAMQGLMSILPQVGGIEGRSPSDEVSDMSITIATKLIEKLREERK